MYSQCPRSQNSRPVASAARSQEKPVHRLTPANSMASSSTVAPTSLNAATNAPASARPSTPPPPPPGNSGAST